MVSAQDEQHKNGNEHDTLSDNIAEVVESAQRPLADTKEGGLPHLPLLAAAGEVNDRKNADDLKPSWRGWIHAGTFPLTIIAGLVLVILAKGPLAQWSSAVFALSSSLLFGISALYHRFNWNDNIKTTLKRFDHANIFLLIAGTYTPISLVALPLDKGLLLLILVWSGALLGIGFRIFWISAPRWLYVPLYLLLGWAAIMYIGDILEANLAAMVLVIVGGLAYTAGAVIYGIKKPNPVPGVFGFHEIFHTLTVIAFLCHWAATLLIVIDPPNGII